MAAVTAAGALVLALSSCATPGAARPAADAPDGQSLGSLMPALPEGDVIGQGTVLDDGDGPALCFVVQESYPPQCSGIPISGWEWEGLEGAETASGVTWGAYAVQGTYDGTSLTVTQPPILLALYDPMVPDDVTGGVPGDTAESTLLEIQHDIHDRLGQDVVSSSPQEGRLWLQVVWDDGTWQRAADDDFGADVVIVQSLLREVG